MRNVERLQDDRAVRGAKLDEVRAGAARPEAAAAGALGALVLGLERAVDAVEQERAQRRVRRRVRGDEPGRAEHEHAQHEARPEREPLHPCSNSSMYPAWRTVLISGGPAASSFLRR